MGLLYSEAGNVFPETECGLECFIWQRAVAVEITGKKTRHVIGRGTQWRLQASESSL